MADRREIPAYRAERFLSPGWLLGDVDAAQRHVDAITTSLEWAKLAPHMPAVTVVARRFPSGFYVARATPRTATISLAVDRPDAWDERLLLHELAHLASHVSGHGPVWRANYLYLLETFTHDPRAETLGYRPGREQAHRLHVGLVRERLRIAAGCAPNLPADLAHLTDPHLSDDAVRDGLEHAFYTRRQTGRRVPA